MLIFSAFIWKYSCLGKLFQKHKTIVEAEIWNLDLIEYVEFDCNFHLFLL